MPFTYDLSTDIGRVRLLINDSSASTAIFAEDSEIQAFLDLEGSVRLAAAQALDTIASNEALVSKKIRTQNLTTDGPAVAKELRERAATLRALDVDADLAAGDDFAIAEFADDVFAWRERIDREWIRSL